MNKLTLSYHLNRFRKAQTKEQLADAIDSLYLFNLHRSVAVMQHMIRGDYIGATKIQLDYVTDLYSDLLEKFDAKGC